MSAAPDYSERVRRLFARPEHVGDARGPVVEAARGDARVRLSAEVGNGRIERLAFRVYGCPHLIAAAEAFCAAFEGRSATGLAQFSATDTIEALGIPVEKTGRILLLEDAIAALRETIGQS